RARRGGGRERLLIDPQRLLQGGRRVLLDDESALLDQRVAHPGAEGGGVHLDLVAAAPRLRILVALAAAGRVEERAEPRLGLEGAVEDRLPPGEAVALLARQPAQRIAGPDRPVAGRRQAAGGGGRAHDGAAHRVSACSIRSATR